MSGDLGDSLNIGRADDFMAELAREQGVESFDFPSTDSENESGTTPPVVPTAGVAAEVTPGSSASTEANTEEPDYKAMYDSLYSLMGKQTVELGELRKMVQPKDEEEEEQQPFVHTPVSDEQEEALIELIEKNGAQAVAQWAYSEAPHLYETALDLWSDPLTNGGDRGGARKAAQFDIRIQTYMERQAEEEEQRQTQQFIASVAPELDQQVTKIGPEYGLDVGTPEVDALLAETLDSAPQALRDLIVSRDVDEREAGLRAILAIAVATGGTPAAPAGDPVAAAALAEAREAALARAKGEATLGTGGLALAAPSIDDSPEAQLAQQIEQLNTAPKPTSVAAGLSTV